MDVSAAAWTTSRAAGVIAFVALALDVMFGLFVSTRLLDRRIPRGASVEVHRWLSGVSLALVAVHALALLADAKVHFDVLDLFVPGRANYRPGALALGICAAYGALLVHHSFALRKRIGVRAWRAIHYTAFAVFVAAVVHGVLLGHGGMRALYLGSSAIVVALVLVRFVPDHA